MAGSATVLEDLSLLSRLDRGLLKLERFFALLSGLA
ncbi:MAG: TRAP transporter small permease, partial [Pseudomonadota bacterium]